MHPMERKLLLSKRGKKNKSLKNTPSVATIKRVVDKEIYSKGEKKQWIKYQNQNALSTCSAAIPVNQNLLPTDMTQGSQNAQRNGNQIRVTSAYIEGWVNLCPYNAITNPLSTPVMIKLYIVKSKITNKQNMGDTPVGTTFFKINNTSVPFQGNLMDLILPIDNSVWTSVATKTFKIGAASASTAGKVGTGGYFDNSSMNQHFKFNYGKHVKKPLKYDDTNGIQNDNLWLLFQCVYADGSTMSLQPAYYSYVTNIHYIDM